MPVANKVTQMPARNVPAAPPTAVDTVVSGVLGRNVNYEIEGEGDSRTLVLLINISPAAVTGAPRSKPNAQTGKGGGNPVLSSTSGFAYLDGLLPHGQQIGIGLNIIAKDAR